MAKKTIEKERIYDKLGISVSKILIANDNNLKPFIELFEFAPENINQQALGKLLGIFEVKDDDDESAYIVNFLTSVSKKEYYINNKRPPVESFESTLHKINIALSELAKNGNIKWLGKLDAVVCALEKNTIHFSVSGGARVLLLRNQTLTDISEDLASEEIEPYPLKTFANVSSGKLENNDKLIITTSDIFHIFSLPEIKKGALHFDKEKFIQFISTALVNELEIAGTIILDVSELPQKEAAIAEKKKKDHFNAFSEASYKKTPPTRAVPSILEKLTGEESQQEYTDDKTGHIYVHGEYQKNKESGAGSLIWFTIVEKSSDLFYWIKENVFKNGFSKAKNGLFALGRMILAGASTLRAKLAQRKFKKEAKETQDFEPTLQKPNKKIFLKILPNFSKMKERLNQMNYQQRIYILLAIIAIFIVPLVWIKFTSKKTASLPQSEVRTEMTKSQLLAQDKNINLNPQIQIFSLGEEALRPIIIKDQLIIIAKQKIINFNNGDKKESALPDNSGNVILAAPMNDLGLIFILTDANKLISFSPITSEFKENNIALPENAKISGMATYLTYLYLIDSQNNNIYRYPRAEGGFGASVGWLKDNLDLKNISSIAIDENVYLADGSQITKLFKGTKQELNLENSATPINFNKVFTDSNTSDLYVFDKNNGRLVKFTKTGEIISQYYNEALEKSKDFTADEKNNKAYFITDDNNLATLDL